MLRVLLAALLLLAVVRVASAQATTTLDSLARAFKAETNPPGLVVGVADGSGTRVLRYGVVSLDDSARVRPDTRFEIGSVTKVFTSLLLAAMDARGTVDLRAPIGDHLPDSVGTPSVEGQPIELRHLATHTSGLPRLPSNFAPANRANPYADYTPAKLHAFLDDVQPSSAPGSTYAYSNVGGGLLGHLLARRAGTSYAALLDRRVLQPLGLDDTYVPTAADTTGPHLATGYTSTDRPAAYWIWDALAGAGALRSTATDLLHFLQMNLQPDESSLAQAIRQTHEIRHRSSKQLALTLGWHVSPSSDGSQFYWHNGGTGGFRSFVGFNRNSDVALVVLSNEALPLRRFNAFAFQLVRALHPSTP